ncbi:hypothetical protein JD844_013544 [Phrynosoma platyrhinos]|uniref:Tumor necrosis factor n=1 Tax=Phrynosoma platyrhinos TaxID=52577 RepID=A0ABQ7TM29_PHRPL|nr:hypothetical protein JD844_013544 [Phrynosoma platyrhinos]
MADFEDQQNGLQQNGQSVLHQLSSGKMKEKEPQSMTTDIRSKHGLTTGKPVEFPTPGTDSKENGKSFSEDLLPKTLKVQALMSRKPAAHAVASLAHRNNLVWTTSVAPSMLENGMRLDKGDNALVVPSTGLYFVYSQLLFHKDSCPSTEPVLLTHTITAWSQQFKSEVELLKSIKTACEAGHNAPGQKRMWFEPIYQGAVFQLYKGDRLWSKTESFEFLDLERQGQIYFGDSKENGKSFSEDLLPKTMKVQALMSRKPAAHAVASLAHPNKLVWTTDVAPSVLENGMRLDKEDNALVVPSTGLYFIYSQLLFHSDSCPSADPILLSHSISSWSEQFKSEVELLKSIKTACEGGHNDPGQKKMWFQSIYQGAVFQLYKGDRLWSKTESLQYLDLKRQGQIYFGVIAM